MANWPHLVQRGLAQKFEFLWSMKFCSNSVVQLTSMNFIEDNVNTDRAPTLSHDAYHVLRQVCSLSEPKPSPNITHVWLLLVIELCLSRRLALSLRMLMIASAYLILSFSLCANWVLLIVFVIIKSQVIQVWRENHISNGFLSPHEASYIPGEIFYEHIFEVVSKGVEQFIITIM